MPDATPTNAPDGPFSTQVKSLLRGVRRVARAATPSVGSVGTVIDSLGRRWNPALHPRDAQGRFIETGGIARGFGVGKGRVTRILPNGHVEMKLTGGKGKVTLKPGQVTMLARPNGKKPVTDDGSEKARNRIKAEDARRDADPDRGDGVETDDEGDRDEDGVPDELDVTPDGPGSKPDPPRTAVRQGPGRAKPGEVRDAGDGFKMKAGPQNGVKQKHDLYDRRGNHVAEIDDTGKPGTARFVAQVGAERVNAGNEAVITDLAKRSFVKQVNGKTWRPTGKDPIDGPSRDKDSSSNGDGGDGRDAQTRADEATPAATPQPEGKFQVERRGNKIIGSNYGESVDKERELGRIVKDPSRPGKFYAVAADGTKISAGKGGVQDATEAIRRYQHGEEVRPWTAKDGPRTNRRITRADAAKRRGDQGGDPAAEAQRGRDEDARRDEAARLKAERDAAKGNGSVTGNVADDDPRRQGRLPGAAERDEQAEAGAKDRPEWFRPPAGTERAFDTYFGTKDKDRKTNPDGKTNAERIKEVNPTRKKQVGEEGYFLVSEDGEREVRVPPGVYKNADLPDKGDTPADKARRDRIRETQREALGGGDDDSQREDLAEQGDGDDAAAAAEAKKQEAARKVAERKARMKAQAEREAQARRDDDGDEESEGADDAQSRREQDDADEQERGEQSAAVRAADDDQDQDQGAARSQDQTDQGQTVPDTTGEDRNSERDSERSDVRDAGGEVLDDVPAERGGEDGAGGQGTVLRQPGAGRGGSNRGGDGGESGALGAADGQPDDEGTSQGDRRGEGQGGDSGRSGVPAEGAGNRGQDAAERAVAVDAAERGAAEGVTGRDFRPSSQADLAGGSGKSQKERAQENLAALRTLRKLQEEGRTEATPDEQAVMAKWGGMGAIRPLFTKAESDRDWKKMRDEFRALVPDDAEWEGLKDNAANAHYTDYAIVDAMWDAVGSLGFERGNVLEPGSGLGNFIMRAPNGAKMHGVEVEPTTAAIAQYLSPSAKIRNEDFGRTRTKGTFDAAIGNVPFGNYRVYDKEFNPKLKKRIHDHFIEKGLASVKPGGVMAMVTSAGTLDKGSRESREAIYKRADLIGSVRLPNGAHQDAAGTDVATDVLLFRVRKPGEKPGDASWLDSSVRLHDDGSPVVGTRRDEEGNLIPQVMNDYYLRHPENVLGEVVDGGFNHIEVRGDFDPESLRIAMQNIVDEARLSGLDFSVDAPDGDDDLFHEPAKRLEASVIEPSRPADAVGENLLREPSQETLSRRGTRLQGSITHVGAWKRNRAKTANASGAIAGKVKVTQEHQFSMVDATGSEVDYTPSQGERDELARLLRMRDLREDLIFLEKSDADDTPQMDALRKELSDAYDEYAAIYGPIGRVKVAWRKMTADQSAKYQAALDKGADPDPDIRARADGDGFERVARTYPSMGGMRNDPSFWSLLSLEGEYDEGSPDDPRDWGTATRGDILSKRQMKPYEPPTTADTADDAVAIVEEKLGKIDLDEVARVLGLAGGARDALAVLGDRVLKDHRTGEWVKYRSYIGKINLRETLRELQEAVKDDPSLRRNIDMITAAIPADKKIADIQTRIGARWMPTETFLDFMRETVGGAAARGITLDVEKDDEGRNKWSVKGQEVGQPSIIGGRYTPDDRTPEQRNTESPQFTPLVAKWGTSRMTFQELVVAALNNAVPEVKDKHTTADGKTYETTNVPETDAAKEMLVRVQNQFATWLRQDPDRAANLERIYNDRFRSRVPANYINSPERALPGMNAAVILDQHQIDGVTRGVEEDAMGAAWEVGVGKTFLAGAVYAERLRLGKSRKVYHTTPNHLVEQTAREFKHLYPDMKILVVDGESMKSGPQGDKERVRRRTLSQMKDGDWDVVIVSESADARILPNLEDLIADKNAQLDKLRAKRQRAEDNGDQNALNTLTNQIKDLEASIAQDTDQLTSEDRMDFTTLGFDYIGVDESHRYKNDLVHGGPPNFNSAGQASIRARNLRAKIDGVRAANRANGGDHGVLLLSGTPVTNNTREFFVNLRMLRPDLLEEAGVLDFDDFYSQFLESAEDIEGTVYGGTQIKVRDGFTLSNAGELVRMWQQAWDVVKAADVGIERPELKGGAMEQVVIPMTSRQEDYYAHLHQRYKDRPRKWKLEKGDDNALAIGNDGLMAAIDMRLLPDKELDAIGVRREDLTDDDGKIGPLAAKVIASYKANRDNIYQTKKGADRAGNRYPDHENPGGLQLIFSDVGVPGGNSQSGFNLYEAMKNRLIADGMNPDEVAFIHDAADRATMKKLTDKARSGEIKVLIGSSAKMATGLNVQDRLTDIWHIDTQKTPDVVEQRNGRGIRRGNQNAEIGIGYITTEGTSEAWAWSVAANKDNFLREFDQADMDSTVIGAPESNEAAPLTQLKATASKDPHMIEQHRAKKDAQGIERAYAIHQGQVEAANATVTRASTRIDAINEQIAAFDKALETFKPVTTGENSNFLLRTADGRSTSKLDDAGAMFERGVREAMTRYPHMDVTPWQEFGSLGGQNLSIRRRLDATGTKKIDVAIKDPTASYYDTDKMLPGSDTTIDPGMKFDSNMAVRLRNLVNRLPDFKQAQVDALADQENALAQARETLTDTRFDRMDELEAARERVTALDRLARFDLTRGGDSPEVRAQRRAELEQDYKDAKQNFKDLHDEWVTANGGVKAAAKLGAVKRSRRDSQAAAADRMNTQIEASGVPLTRVPRKTRTLSDEEAAAKAKSKGGKTRTRPARRTGDSSSGEQGTAASDDDEAEGYATPEQVEEVSYEEVAGPLTELGADVPERQDTDAPEASALPVEDVDAPEVDAPDVDAPEAPTRGPRAPRTGSSGGGGGGGRSGPRAPRPNESDDDPNERGARDALAAVRGGDRKAALAMLDQLDPEFVPAGANGRTVAQLREKVLADHMDAQTRRFGMAGAPSGEKQGRALGAHMMRRATGMDDSPERDALTVASGMFEVASKDGHTADGAAAARTGVVTPEAREALRDLADLLDYDEARGRALDAGIGANQKPIREAVRDFVDGYDSESAPAAPERAPDVTPDDAPGEGSVSTPLRGESTPANVEGVGAAPGDAPTGGLPPMQAPASAGPNLTNEDYEGTPGNRNHITRNAKGTLPTSALADMLGAEGEVPGEHARREGKEWDDFLADVRENGIKEPVFVTVEPDGTATISEGNHRRDAAVELGMPDIPVQVRYYGHGERVNPLDGDGQRDTTPDAPGRGDATPEADAPASDVSGGLFGAPAEPVSVIRQTHNEGLIGRARTLVKAKDEAGALELLKRVEETEPDRIVPGTRGKTVRQMRERLEARLAKANGDATPDATPDAGDEDAYQPAPGPSGSPEAPGTSGNREPVATTPGDDEEGERFETQFTTEDEDSPELAEAIRQSIADSDADLARDAERAAAWANGRPAREPMEWEDDPDSSARGELRKIEVRGRQAEVDSPEWRMSMYAEGIRGFSDSGRASAAYNEWLRDADGDTIRALMERMDAEYDGRWTAGGMWDWLRDAKPHATPVDEELAGRFAKGDRVRLPNGTEGEVRNVVRDDERGTVNVVVDDGSTGGMGGYPSYDAASLSKVDGTDGDTTPEQVDVTDEAINDLTSLGVDLPERPSNADLLEAAQDSGRLEIINVGGPDRTPDADEPEVGIRESGEAGQLDGQTVLTGDGLDVEVNEGFMLTEDATPRPKRPTPGKPADAMDSLFAGQDDAPEDEWERFALPADRSTFDPADRAGFAAALQYASEQRRSSRSITDSNGFQYDGSESWALQHAADAVRRNTGAPLTWDELDGELIYLAPEVVQTAMHDLAGMLRRSGKDPVIGDGRRLSDWLEEAVRLRAPGEPTVPGPNPDAPALDLTPRRPGVADPDATSRAIRLLADGDYQGAMDALDGLADDDYVSGQNRTVGQLRQIVQNTLDSRGAGTPVAATPDPSERWNLGSLPNPSAYADNDKGKGRLARALRTNGTADGNDKGALEIAASALTDKSWARGGGPDGTGKELADLDADQLAALNMTREDVDARIAAVSDLADELSRLGHGTIRTATVNGEDMAITDYLRKIVGGYVARRDAANAPDAPSVDGPVDPGPPPRRVLTTPGALNVLKEMRKDLGSMGREDGIVRTPSPTLAAMKKAARDGLIERVDKDEDSPDEYLRSGYLHRLTPKGQAALDYDEWSTKQRRWATSPEARDAALAQAQQENADAGLSDPSDGDAPVSESEVLDALEEVMGRPLTDAEKAGLDVTPPAKPKKPAKPLKRDEVTFHESYGDVSRGQLAAYKKHNVPPATHDELVGYYGEDNHEAIREAVTDPANHMDGSSSFSDYKWRQNRPPEDTAEAFEQAQDAATAGDGGRDGGDTDAPAPPAADEPEPQGPEDDTTPEGPATTTGTPSSDATPAVATEEDPTPEAVAEESADLAAEAETVDTTLPEPKVGKWQRSITVDESDPARPTVTGTSYGDPDEIRNALKSNSFSWDKDKKEWWFNKRWAKNGLTAEQAAENVRAALRALDATEGDDSEDGNPLEGPDGRVHGEDYAPSPEQRSVIDAVRAGKNVVVRALAGAGKTSTLLAIARRMRDKNIIYVAFNKSVKQEADEKFKGLRHVEVRTANSLAWAAMPDWMTRKPNVEKGITAGRYDAQADPRSARAGLRNNKDLADHFGVTDHKPKDGEPVTAEEITEAARRTLGKWLISDADEIGPGHVPADVDDDLREQNIALAKRMWDDLNSEDGRMWLDQDVMVKRWALSRPDFAKSGKSGLRRGADTIFFDEAQDINPVLAKIVRDQGIQKVYVGDGNQAIYGFRGAVDELDNVKLEADLPLTHSYRFGPVIAGIANRFLSVLGSPHKVKGARKDKAGTILPEGSMDLADTDAVLTRSNGGMLAYVAEGLLAGRLVGAPGGTKADLQSVIATAKYLQDKSAYNAAVKRGESPDKPEMPRRLHEDLAQFKTWEEFDKAAEEGNDAKVKMFSRIFEEYSPEALSALVEQIIDLDEARKGAKEKRVPNLIISTAHKAKGLEWERVKIGVDFRGPLTDRKTGEYIKDAEGNLQFPDAEEFRLAYVAFTRAKGELDPGSLSYIFDLTDEDGNALYDLDGKRLNGRDRGIDVTDEVAEVVADAGRPTPDVTPDATPATPDAPPATRPTPDVVPDAGTTPDAGTPDTTPATPDAPAAPGTDYDPGAQGDMTWVDDPNAPEWAGAWGAEPVNVAPDAPKTEADWAREAHLHNIEVLDRIASVMDIERGGDGFDGGGLDMLGKLTPHWKNMLLFGHGAPAVTISKHVPEETTLRLWGMTPDEMKRYGLSRFTIPGALTVKDLKRLDREGLGFERGNDDDDDDPYGFKAARDRIDLMDDDELERAQFEAFSSGDDKYDSDEANDYLDALAAESVRRKKLTPEQKAAEDRDREDEQYRLAAIQRDPMLGDRWKKGDPDPRDREREERERAKRERAERERAEEEAAAAARAERDREREEQRARDDAERDTDGDTDRDAERPTDGDDDGESAGQGSDDRDRDGDTDGDTDRPRTDRDDDDTDAPGRGGRGGRRDDESDDDRRRREDEERNRRRRDRDRDGMDGDGLDGDGLDGPDGPDGPGRRKGDDDDERERRERRARNRRERNRRRRNRRNRRGRNGGNGGPGLPGLPDLPNGDPDRADDPRNPRDGADDPRNPRGRKDRPKKPRTRKDRPKKPRTRKERMAARKDALTKAPPTNDAPGATPEQMRDTREQFDAANDVSKLLPAGPAPTDPVDAEAERDLIATVLDLPSLDALASHEALADGDGLVGGKSYADLTNDVLTPNLGVLTARATGLAGDRPMLDWLDDRFGPDVAAAMRRGASIPTANLPEDLTDEEAQSLFGMPAADLKAMRSGEVKVPGTVSLRDKITGRADADPDTATPQPTRRVPSSAGVYPETLDARTDALERAGEDGTTDLEAEHVLPNDRIDRDGQMYAVDSTVDTDDGMLITARGEDTGDVVTTTHGHDEPVRVDAATVAAGLDDDSGQGSALPGRGDAGDPAAPDAAAPPAADRDPAGEGASTPTPAGAPDVPVDVDVDEAPDTRNRTRTGRVESEELRVGDVIDAKRTDGTEGPITVQSVKRNGYRAQVTGTDPDGRTVFASLNEHGAKVIDGRGDDAPAAWGAEVPPATLGDNTGSTLPGDLRVGDVIDGTVLRESTGPGLRTSKRIPARLRITGEPRRNGGFSQFPVERVENDGTPTGEKSWYSVPDGRPVNVRSRAAGTADAPSGTPGAPDAPQAPRSTADGTPDGDAPTGAGVDGPAPGYTATPDGGGFAAGPEGRGWTADYSPAPDGGWGWNATGTGDNGPFVAGGNADTPEAARAAIAGAVLDGVNTGDLDPSVLESPAFRDGAAAADRPELGLPGPEAAPEPGAPRDGGSASTGGAEPGNPPRRPSTSTPEALVPTPTHERPSTAPVPDPVLPAPPEDVQGRKAEWRPASTIAPGDLIRAEGTSVTGGPAVAAGYVLTPPIPVGVTVRGERATRPGWAILTAENADGTGRRGLALVDDNALVAFSPPTDAPGMTPGEGMQTANDRNVIDGNLPDVVPTDSEGVALFPGALVTGPGGAEGIVIAARDMDVTVQWGSGDSEDIAPTNLRVTAESALVPDGWDKSGRRLPTEPDQDVTTKLAPTTKDASQVTADDTILLPAADGDVFPARVTGVLTDGDQQVIDYTDTRDGEPGRVSMPSTSPVIALTGGQVATEDVSVPDVIEGGSLPIEPVDEPAVIPRLLTSQRRALRSLALDLDPTAPPDAAQAAARIRAGRGVTAGQAKALADALRTIAPDDRTMGRIADTLEGHGHRMATSDGPGDDRQQQVRAGDLTIGDYAALPSGDGTLTAGRVVHISPVANGRLRQVQIATVDGTERRVVDADAPAWWLPDLGDSQGRPTADNAASNRALAGQAADAQASEYARVIGEHAASTVAGTRTIHELRERVAGAVTPQALKPVTGNAAQRWYDQLTRSGLLGDAERVSYLDAADARRQAVEDKARKAILDTINDAEPLDGEKWEDTQDRIAGLLMAAGDSAHNARAPRGARAGTPDPTGVPGGPVQDTLFDFVDATGATVAEAIPDAPRLTARQVERIVATQWRRKGLGVAAVAEELGVSLLRSMNRPKPDRPVWRRLVEAIQTLGARIARFLRDALRALDGAVNGKAWRRRMARVMAGIRRRLTGTPEWDAVNRALGDDDGDGGGTPTTGGGPDLPKPGGFGLREGVHYVAKGRDGTPIRSVNGVVPDVAEDGGPDTATLANLDTIGEAGRALAGRVDAMVTRRTGGTAELERAQADATAAEDAWLTTGSPEAGELAAASRAAAEAVARRVTTATGKAALAQLAKARPMGPTSTARLNVTGGTREQRAALAWAERFVPTDWLEKVTDKPVELVDDDHGWYDPESGRMALADLGQTVEGVNGYARSAMHEMWHHVEAHMPDLQRAQAAYHFRRTSTGEVGARLREGQNRSVSLAESLPGRGFTRDDRAREDEFLNPYAGREYGNGRAWELLTTASESLFAGDGYLDDDMRYFMLGLLEKLAVNEGRRAR